MKIQKAVKDETIHIALGVLVLSVLMQAVFLLIGQWNSAVLWGNVLGGVYAVLNFFILGLTVQKVANDGDEKRGKSWMQFSYSTRMFGTVVIVFLGITLPIFNWLVVLLCQFFPRITIAYMGVTGKHAKDAQKEQEMKEAAARHSQMITKIPKKKKAVSVDVAEAEAEAAEAEAEAALAKAKAARARAKAAAAKAAAEEEPSDEE